MDREVLSQLAAVIMEAIALGAIGVLNGQLREAKEKREEIHGCLDECKRQLCHQGRQLLEVKEGAR